MYSAITIDDAAKTCRHGDQQGLTNKKRLRINVGGLTFETFQSTVERFPDTLLGCYEKRVKFYDPVKDEYRFDRDKHTFDAILFYYQSRGILCRPEHIPSRLFKEELRFYEIHDMRFPCLEKVLKKAEESDKKIYSGRERLWQILENPDFNIVAKYLSFISLTIIILSILTYCLETVDVFQHEKILNNTYDYFFILECIWVTWFTLELILRLFVAPNFIGFLFSPYGFIDTVAIIPFFVTLLISSGGDPTSFAVIRLIRITRCLRLLKLTRYHSTTPIIAAAIRDCQGNLRTLALCIFITVILFSSSIYYVEEFGEEESQFQSIPDTFYYTIITMVTVGYGDYVPRTVLGRILGSFCSFSGIIVLYCLPTPIIVMRFIQLYREHVLNEMERTGRDTAVFKDALDSSDNLFSKQPSVKRKRCVK